MLTRRTILQLPALPLSAALLASNIDWRNVANGLPIPDENYSDQPYVVLTRTGDWLCVLTTGQGVEGRPGQHAVATRSTDRGKTWTPLIDIEPASGPEASWVMPLAVPGGRVYAFYTYNKGNLRRVNSNTDGTAARVDTMGAYVYKYSDDGGRTWSEERYEIPMRQMRIDRGNTHSGKVMFFWGVGKPIVVSTPPPRPLKGSPKGAYAIFGFAKVGKWGQPGTMVESQGCFLRSERILTGRDPKAFDWTLLPDGDEGLRAPKGPVSDEANLVSLSDGSLYATYRTIDGYNCQAYSRDGGHQWESGYAEYTPGGRRIKHPRAANFVKKFSNGKYLLWFHNHGGEAVHTSEDWGHGRSYYQNRNPAWVAGGIERNGVIHWSQPEILLYDDNPATRISYPDFVEQDGLYWATETQKTEARVHALDRELLQGLWSPDERSVTKSGLAAHCADCSPNGTLNAPALPDLRERGGFCIDFWIDLRELTPGQTLLDAMQEGGKGWRLTTSSHFGLRFEMADGTERAAWDSDPGTHPGTLRVNRWQHVSLRVDGGPKIISWVIDGEFNDGGATRQFGWSRFPPSFGSPAGPGQIRLAPLMFGEMKNLRIYSRCLRTAESVSNFRAGPKA